MIGETQKEDMRDFLVKAYADGVIGDGELETRLTAMEAAEEPSALVAMVEEVRARYPLAPVASAAVAASAAGEAQAIRGRGMSKKYRGRWFSSERILVELSMSTVLLDFSELEYFPGSRIDILVDLRASTLKVVLPRGAEVTEEVDTDFSTVKIRRRGENDLGIEVRIRGAAHMSTVKVKAR
jgi:hypothetical protein